MPINRGNGAPTTAAECSHGCPRSAYAPFPCPPAAILLLGPITDCYRCREVSANQCSWHCQPPAAAHTRSDAPRLCRNVMEYGALPLPRPTIGLRACHLSCLFRFAFLHCTTPSTRHDLALAIFNPSISRGLCTAGSNKSYPHVTSTRINLTGSPAPNNLTSYRGHLR